jgi:ribosomal protein L31
LRENSFGINYYFEETYDDCILPYVRLAQVRGKKYLTESTYTYNYAEEFPEKKNRKFWFLLDSDTLSNPFWTGKKSKNWNEDALTQVSKFKKRYSLKK